MLKNFWLCTCLMLCISPVTWASVVSEGLETQDEDALYRADRPPAFDAEEQELNDQGLIRDEAAPAVEGQPYRQPLKAKASDCTKMNADGEECEDLDIGN